MMNEEEEIAFDKWFDDLMNDSTMKDIKILTHLNRDLSEMENLKNYFFKKVYVKPKVRIIRK